MVCDREGTPSEVLAHVVDLTEYRRLEQHAQAAERLEGLSTLAGGIAHDFGSLLTVIQGASQVLRNPSGKVDEEALAAIQASVDSASRLTKQLLAFSRDGAVEVTRVPIDQRIHDMQEVFRALLGKDIELQLELGCPKGFVNMSAQQLEQVLINLVANAGHAMPDGGTLHIQTQSKDAEETHLQLWVRDSGAGMDNATKARAFEPFFTTRSAEGGTGLGLSTVYGIVRRFGGMIELDSEAGRGTQICIEWPLDQTTEDTPRAPSIPRPHPHGSAHVLVVDDQPLVCKVVRRILEGEGYQVTTVHGVAEARTFLGQAQKIDCVLTDIMLQDGSGTELVDLARARWPNLPFLYMSGYTAAHLSQENVLIEPRLLLQKPFTPVQLHDHIAAALDA
jgi:nitrogen-specific signal transduction histidine kinase/CheY-like chemotaxis protein